jgi:hypothetical protein
MDQMKATQLGEKHLAAEDYCKQLRRAVCQIFLMAPDLGMTLTQIQWPKRNPSLTHADP